MMGMGYSEMLLFGMIALMLFGARLPEVARTLGGTYRELKKSINDFQKEFQGFDRLDTPLPPKINYSKDDEKSVDSPTTATKFIPPTDDDDAE